MHNVIIASDLKTAEKKLAHVTHQVVEKRHIKKREQNEQNRSHQNFFAPWEMRRQNRVENVH